MARDLNISVTDNTYELVERLARRYDVIPDEVWRLGIGILNFATEEIDNGGCILVQRDGKVREVVFLNLEMAQAGDLKGTVVKPIDPIVIKEPHSEQPIPQREGDGRRRK